MKDSVLTLTPPSRWTVPIPPRLHFLASWLLFYNILDVLGSLEALAPTSIVFLSRSQQTALTGPSSLTDRPHPSPTVPSLDGPRILLPAMFILQPSLKDALRRQMEGVLEISSPPPLFPREWDQGLENTLPSSVAREGVEAGQEPRGFSHSMESPLASQPLGPQSRRMGWFSSAHPLPPNLFHFLTPQPYTLNPRVLTQMWSERWMTYTPIGLESASPKNWVQRLRGAVLEGEWGSGPMSKSSQGVPECGRREREPGGHIFPSPSASLAQSGGRRGPQEGVGREQHPHPTADPGEL